MGKNGAEKIIWIALAVLSLCVFAAGILLGSTNISLSLLFSDRYSLILRSIRLPRTLAAGLAGAGLAVSGLVLQTVTNNKLCAPNIIGINGGAGFFTVLQLCVFQELWAWSSFFSFAGAMTAAFLVLGIASAASGRLDKSTVILVGVAVGAFFNSGIYFLRLLHPNADVDFNSFLIGGLSGVRLREVAVPGIVIVICIFVLLLSSSKVQLMLLGDDMAVSLGLNVRRTRFLLVSAAAVLSACVVSFAGLLGFVGLVAPHISRSLVGQSIRKNILACTLTGWILVIAADLLGRVLFAPSVLPAGVITSAIGAPFFLVILFERRRRQ